MSIKESVLSSEHEGLNAAAFGDEEEGFIVFWCKSAKPSEKRIGRFPIEIPRGDAPLCFAPVLDLKQGGIRELHTSSSLAGVTAGGSPNSVIELRSALGMAAQWRKAGLALRLSCRISDDMARSSSLPPLVSGLLAEYDFPPDALDLEISATAAAHDRHAQVEQVLNELGCLGVSLTLSNYGALNDSVSCLRRWPITRLKIAKEITATILVIPWSYTLAHATATLADLVGIDVLVDGVESEELLTALREMGCGYAQGSAVGEAVAPADVLERFGKQ